MNQVCVNIRDRASVKQNKRSDIYLCQKNNENYAFKIFIESFKNKRVKNELQTLLSIDCVNVVKIIDHFEYKSHPVLILEYCQETLYQNLKK